MRFDSMYKLLNPGNCCNLVEIGVIGDITALVVALPVLGTPLFLFLEVLGAFEKRTNTAFVAVGLWHH